MSHRRRHHTIILFQLRSRASVKYANSFFGNQLNYNKILLRHSASVCVFNKQKEEGRLTRTAADKR